MYDYNIRTYDQQKNILDEKTAKNFPVIVAEYIEGKVDGQQIVIITQYVKKI